MIQIPMDVLHQFPVRKSQKQKQEFRNAVRIYAESLGYGMRVEKGKFGSRNLVIGDPEGAEYLVTAHYDTPAHLLFPNLITPCSFMLFSLHRLLFAGILALIFLCAVNFSILLFADHRFSAVLAAAFVFLLAALTLIGPANPNNSNDNTSGVVTLLEIVRSIPENQRKKVCFVLFDLEEAGLIGSSSYRKAHKSATDHQLVLNLDCVGDGDHILMIPTKQLKKDKKKLASLYKACGYFGKKSVLVKDKGFSVYPSDQRSFPYGVGICALNEGKCGLYLSRIHTPKDTVLDHTNVNILRAALISFISCNAANRKEEMK